MDWGSPLFVLAIIGMAMFAGVLKSWGKSAHGIEGKRGRRGAIGAEAGEVTRLREENAQLRDRLELHEDRIIVLEKIVTDSGYDIAHQIERLRDRDPAPRIETSRDRAPN
ncbi:MAG TPA: hypothetical protein VLA37_10190 [Sphingomonadaceae bacterium]|nr:hypothetical protein [Sphingomonadaceae bacterium]